jgi:hypothetical protein
VLHQIKLKDNKHAARTGEVLSEGEFRIVSLAAFLADAKSQLVAEGRATISRSGLKHVGSKVPTCFMKSA